MIIKGLLPAKRINLTVSIAILKARTDILKDEYIRILAAIENIAKAQSIGSSNAIEGIFTIDVRINAISNRISAPLNYNEAIIAGLP